jgi:hypothetical protein
MPAALIKPARLVPPLELPDEPDAPDAAPLPPDELTLSWLNIELRSEFPTVDVVVMACPGRRSCLSVHEKPAKPTPERMGFAGFLPWDGGLTPPPHAKLQAITGEA